MSPLSKRSISDLLLAIGTCAFFYQSSGTPWSLLIVILFGKHLLGLSFQTLLQSPTSSPVLLSVSQIHTGTPRAPCPDSGPAINKISLSLIPSPLTSQKQEDFLFPEVECRSKEINLFKQVHDDIILWIKDVKLYFHLWSHTHQGIRLNQQVSISAASYTCSSSAGHCGKPIKGGLDTGPAVEKFTIKLGRKGVIQVMWFSKIMRVR